MPETMCASLPLAEVFQDEHLDPARGHFEEKSSRISKASANLSVKTNGIFDLNRGST